MRPKFEKVIRAWSNIEECQREEHYNSIKICLFSPFLFGKSYVSDDWLDWMQLAGFLKSSKRLEVKCYEDSYFFALDTLEKMFEALRTNMEAPIFFFSCLTVIDEIDSLAHKPEDCIRIAKTESPFCDFLDSEGDTFEKKMAVLYSVKSYIEYVHHVVKSGKNRFKDNSPHLQKRIQAYKSKGNSKFQDGHYNKAISLYTKALHLDPHNHFLYGNRAQTYLKTEKFQEALWDSRRALVLESNWAKGCYRYAQAFFELNYLERAIRENESGLKFAEEPNERRDLQLQKKRFYDFKNDLEKGKKGVYDDDDVPDLVEQGGSSDESGADRSDSESMPDLVSDGLDSFSDDASESEFIEPTQNCLMRIREKRSQRLSKRLSQRLSQRLREKKKPEKTEKKMKTIEIKLKLNRKKPGASPSVSISPVSSKVKKAELKKESVTKPKPEPIPKPDTTPKPDPTPKLSNDELRKELALGSEYHLDKKKHDALTQYQKALKLIHECPVKYGGMNELEYVSFTYCFGHICLTSVKPQEIQKSEQLFGGILKDHADIYFPLAYYGLGCYFQTINRFPEAVEQLKKGEKCLNESPEPQPVIFWPGTLKPVKESVSDFILESFEELIHDCKNPPKPLAVCHFENCTYSKRDIYLTDIDFKGYVHIVCTEDCRLDYHIGCWKLCKVDFHNRTHEKDILSKACSTPDCLGTIYTISTYGNDGRVRSEAKVDANTKPKHLQKSAQQPQPAMTKSKKKRQKKKLKKTAEEETAATITEATTNEHTESQTKSKESKPKKETHTTSVVEETLDEKDVVGGEELKKEQKQEIFEKQEDYQFVLKKDDIKETQPTNQKTVKKKKQKLKKALSDFELKFSGDEERRFLRHEDADEYGYIDFSKFIMPSVAEDESRVSSDISGSGDAQALSLENLENIDETVFMIYSYFHAVLEKEGPLPITSNILLDDFKSFPPEAHMIVKATGGLAQFLLKSLKFAMFEDYICLLKHAVRCKEILARKHGDVVNTDLEPVAAPYHQSPERTVRDFQPLLTPFDIQDLNVHGSKSNLIHSMNKYIKSQETVDGVDEIKINDLGSDEDKLSEESDADSSETDENEELDEDDSSVSQEDKPEKDEKEFFNPESGYQVGKNDSSVGIADPRKEPLVVDFEGDEEYIDDEILGKELELERYMMEGSYGSDPILNDLARDIQSIPDNGDPLNIESSKPSLVQQPPVYLSNKSNDSGVDTVSPNDMEQIDQSSNPKDDEINGKFTIDSSSVLPPEILEGFCLNKPTPFGPIVTSESYESYSISSTTNGSEESSDTSEEKNLEGEKIWQQGLDLVTALEADLDWFTLEKTPDFYPEETGEVMQIPAYVWKMTLSSIIKLRDHCTAIQKKKSHMKTKYVQCTPKSKNVCLNTTPYEPYKQEYLEMVAKKDNLQESLKDTMTKYIYLKKSGVVEREELKTVKLQNEELSKKMNEKLALAEQNQKKWQTERSSYIHEGKTKDDKLQTLDEDLVKMTTEMSKKDHKLNQMSQHIFKERETFKTEQNKLKELVEISSQSSQTLRNRAEESEVKLLELMCTNQCKTLMDVVKEAETNRDKLINSEQVDKMEAMQTWQKTITVNTKKVREVKNIYDGLIQKVKSRTSLDKLLPITDVLPYWPPPQSVKPSKKAVSSDIDANQAGNPQGQTKIAATATVAPSNAASQKNTWLNAQQSEARRRETLYMASNSHQTNTTQKLYEGYQDSSQWQQQHLQQQQQQQQQYQHQQHQNLPHASQNNFTPYTVGQFTQSHPAQVYSNPLGRGGGNLHAMAQGGPPDVLHSGISRPSHTAASYSVPQQATAPTAVPASSTSLENKINPTAAFASAAKPVVVPEKSQANPLQQTHSLGATAGRNIGPIPSAPPHLKKSFDKLIYQLGVIFDNRYTKGQLAMFLNKVREANGGSLSGLPAKDIIDRVVKLVLKREEDHPVNQPAKQAYPKKLPPGISMAREPGLNTWKTMPIKQTKILNLEEEDPCVICHEEMPMKPVSKLECQHVFHTDCIQRWMNEQKTCPTCREFVLLPDDYPSL